LADEYLHCDLTDSGSESDSKKITMNKTAASDFLDYDGLMKHLYGSKITGEEESYL
jgi:hypothetical protein